MSLAVGLLQLSAATELIGLVVIAAILVAAATWILTPYRRSASERERRRRLTVHREGRMGDGTLTDFRDATLYYSYSVGGVAYTASQDVSSLQDRLPPDPSSLIGHVSLRYHPRNPANSILLCENWSGLRSQSHQGLEAAIRTTSKGV